jgi:hypothetical protein
LNTQLPTSERPAHERTAASIALHFVAPTFKRLNGRLSDVQKGATENVKVSWKRFMPEWNRFDNQGRSVIDDASKRSENGPKDWSSHKQEEKTKTARMFSGSRRRVQPIGNH